MIAMTRCILMLLALLGAGAACAANDVAAQTAYEAAKNQADARYGEDRKLCADESTSALRMQCLRDARQEHERALAAAAAKLDAANKSAASAAGCSDCGSVTAVSMTERDGQGSAVGMIAGGVAGALLGHQVGKGTGKDLATIAGAAGGAYAGNKIEGKMNKVRTWTVTVRFDNGAQRVFSFDHDPGMAIGDPVKASGASIVRR